MARCFAVSSSTRGCEKDPTFIPPGREFSVTNWFEVKKSGSNRAVEPDSTDITTSKSWSVNHMPSIGAGKGCAFNSTSRPSSRQVSARYELVS